MVYRGLGSYFLKFLQTLNFMIFNPLSTTLKIPQRLQVESESDFDIECFYVFQISKKAQRMFCFTTIRKRYNSHFGVPVCFRFIWSFRDQRRYHRKRVSWPSSIPKDVRWWDVKEGSLIELTWSHGHAAPCPLKVWGTQEYYDEFIRTNTNTNKHEDQFTLSV